MTFRNSIETPLIMGIISELEYLDYFNNDQIDKNGTVLIAIKDPGQYKHPEFKVQGFDDVLQVQFWDIEKDCDEYKCISPDTGKIIRDFIIKNKNKRFLIHCAAGISRSAGVGLAVECLIQNNGNKYEKAISGSKITEHARYHPNLKVYDIIIGD